MPYVPPIYTKVCQHHLCGVTFDTYYENAKYCCGKHREAAHKARSRSRHALRTHGQEGSQGLPSGQVPPGLAPANAARAARDAAKELNSPQGRKTRAKICAIAVARGDRTLSEIVDENMDIYELILAEVQAIEATGVVPSGLAPVGTPGSISEAQDIAESTLHELGYGKPAEVVPLPGVNKNKLTAPVAPLDEESSDAPGEN